MGQHVVRRASLLGMLLAPLLCLSVPAQAMFSVNFGDFDSPAPSMISRNGDAAFLDGVLRLTPDGPPGVAGSAFLNAPFAINATASFSTHFEFRIHGQRAGRGDGADGLVFIVQNDPRGVAAIGTDGTGMGYANGGYSHGPPIAHSIGIAFDTFPFQREHGNIELLKNGTDTLAESLQNFDFASGKPLNVWIDYNGNTDLLDVYLSASTSKPSSAFISRTVALDKVVGSQAFFGFSAATGARFNIHDINDWQLTYDRLPIPEPSAAAALAVMLGVMGFELGRRSKPRGAKQQSSLAGSHGE